MTEAQPVSVAEGYERWAPTYPQDAGNPVMRAEQALMRALWPALRGARALDLGCGSGRYTQWLCAEAAEVVALDLSAGMLSRVQGALRVRADMRRLPLRAARFDVAVAGLAIGHFEELADWFREAARVLAPGGTLLYSDFHADAAQAGPTRTFDVGAARYRLPHHVHTLEAQRAAAAAAGLRWVGEREARAGIELTEQFPGSEAFYRRWHGLALVLAVRVERP